MAFREEPITFVAILHKHHLHKNKTNRRFRRPYNTQEV